jgi:hypothetical protein
VADWNRSFSLSIDPDRLLGPLISGVDAILSYGISILEIADLMLSVIESLLFGLLDPIRAILEALIQEIKNFIRDLKAMGLYVTGDFKLITPDNYFADIVGGFQAYEQRMLARLVDRSDVNRPDFSPSARTMGVFFYVSSGDIGSIVRAIASLLALLGIKGKGTSTMPPPALPKAEFKTNAISGEDELTVSWTYSQVAGAVSGLMAPAPSGFIVEVSTVPNGLQLVALSENDQNSTTPTPTIATSVCLDPLSGRGLALYGGIGVAGAGSSGGDWETLENGPQQVRLRLDQATPLVKPSQLRNPGKQPYLGAAYYVKAGVFPRLLPGQVFSATFTRDMLPEHASIVGGDIQPAPDNRSYYIRVRAVGSDFADAIEDRMGLGILDVGSPKPLYNSNARLFFFTPAGVRNSFATRKFYPEASTVTSTGTVKLNQVSFASSPVSVTFPSGAVKEYRRAVQAAITVAILARMDLKPPTNGKFSLNRSAPGTDTGVESFIAEMLIKFGWFNLATPSAQEKFRDTTSFRAEVLSVAEQIAVELTQLNPPSDTLAEMVVDRAQAILDFKFRDMDLFELLESETTAFGLAATPQNLPNWRPTTLSGPARAPGFMLKPGVEENSVWIQDVGSADASPVLYGQALPNGVEYFRNTAIANGLLEPAATVIRIAAGILARPKTDSQWIAVRLFQQNLTPVTDLLDALENYIDGFLDGLQGLLDAIIARIQALRARLHQLQALLETIRALLHSLMAFTITPISALIVTGDGTDGLTANFMNAGEKPQDGPGSFGAGAAFVVGDPGLIRILSLLGF